MSKANYINRCAYPWQQMIIDLTGEVVPCCFWAGYGNFGKPLGNTNENTLDEIWNGEAYKDLRKKIAEDDLDDHPCGNCMAYRWGNNTFPRFTWPAGFTHESGLCFFGQIDEEFERRAGKSGDPIVLYEDGAALATAGAPHDEIREHGMGRYAVWNGWIYFSSSDNSDPMSNGRSYVLKSGEMSIELGGLVEDSQSGRNLKKAYAEFNEGVLEVEAQPSMLSYISTADCNIDCPACSQNMVRVTKVQHRAETTPDVLTKVPFLAQFIWHGGEPYLIKQFREFVDQYEVADNPNLSFGFTSNGTQITERELAKLKKFPRINASVSCDSFTRETFEVIRAGANYDRVVEHIKNLIDAYKAPQRVFSVGMIVCKSNMHELADNLQFAIDHDIALNLSPVVLYPTSEHLGVFEDFPAQTRGWREQIVRARDIVARAKDDGRLSVRRIDPSGMIEEIAQVFERASQEYEEITELTLRVVDADQRLRLCKQPVAVVYDEQGAPCAYRTLVPGEKDYVVKLPTARIANAKFRIDILHNVMEPSGYVANARLQRTEQGYFFPDDPNYFLSNPKNASPAGVTVSLGAFHPAKRARNVTWSTYGASTPDGLNVKQPEDVFEAYREMYADEIGTGQNWRITPNAAWRRFALSLREGRPRRAAKTG